LAISRLQKQSNQPVISLESSDRKKTEQGEYSLRFSSRAENEFGNLVTRISLVLEGLQLGDEQMREGRRKLELLVGQQIENMLLKFDDALATVEEKLVFLAARHRILLQGGDAPGGHVGSGFSFSMAETFHLVGKALLVDDESINRTVLATVLEKIGLQVEVAESGIEALQMIEADDFLLVLMDIHMPEMSGFEVTKKIRILEQQMRRKRLMIIAMTANDDEISRRECFEVGMDDFLTKPIKPEILLERIVTLVATDKTHNIVPSALSEQKTAQNKPDRELWSRAQAVALVGDDEALFCELATVFLGRNDLLLKNIEVALKRGDTDDLLETAHAYKGAIGYFACPTLRRSAIALENLARTGRVAGGDVHLAELRDKSRLLCSDLSQLVLEARRGGKPA
jgi:CheY-like chemotaxis protein